MQPAQMYDSAATMFSPDGRIYQVEYAREAVKRGTTAVGIVYDEGILLLVDKRVGSRLIEPLSIEKLFKIDKHIGAASSGLVADARSLVRRARADAQNNRYVYDEPIELSVLVKSLSDTMQACTQNGGIRPFGTALLVAGIDALGPHLYETDPSGALISYHATAIGSARQGVLEYLEEHYTKNLSLADAAKMAFTSLSRAGEGSANENTAPDVAIVTKTDGYRKLSPDEVKQWQESYG